MLGVSSSGFYNWIKLGSLPISKLRQRAQVAVKAVFNEKKCRYGSPRIYRELKAKGQRIGKTVVEKVMKDLGLKARAKRKFVKTTDSDHKNKAAPNLLERKFHQSEVGAVWLSDITYLRLKNGGFIYLCVVMDLASREIVGWQIRDNMETDLLCAALVNAAESCDKVLKGTIFHSDQGSQYASDEFRKLLSLYGLKQSMSRRGQCWDNAPMESFFSSLKEECEQLSSCTTLQQAQTELFDYIEIFFNRERLHSAIGYKAPWCYKETRDTSTLN